ncbi:excalibur calcium-binding domain-containing protein [Mycobacterium sp. 236(2023)]|uniref:excalibur calcium-binding domain-containing protein n=1 Tax=Mycobacterium sp. 236(2023) TaxID=3038163 RepID=UPI002414F513|nr:excalibur calcium-binding domain-containing protein [Mycobacterium sp. 236(2023)]MDG4663706.1 excalibur calcium-binding domain-containing protein [Mycobacterium sp. 236(2023)]
MRAPIITIALGAIVIGGAATASAQPGPTRFVNYSAAEGAGNFDHPSLLKYYGPHLDRDDDGIGCES